METVDRIGVSRAINVVLNVINVIVVNSDDSTGVHCPQIACHPNRQQQHNTYRLSFMCQICIQPQSDCCRLSPIIFRRYKCTWSDARTMQMVHYLSSDSSSYVQTRNASVIAAGSLSGQETGSDGFAGSGALEVAGSVAAQESVQDAASLSGSVSVAGVVSAQEAGSDTIAGELFATLPAIEAAIDGQEVGQDTCVILLWPSLGLERPALAGRATLPGRTALPARANLPGRPALQRRRIGG